MITLPTQYPSDVLSFRQLIFLAKRLPQPYAFTGRPAYSNLELLPGILKVLRSGCRWRDLDRTGSPSGITHWRRLQFWRKSTRLKLLWEYILKGLSLKRKLDMRLLAIDGSLIPSFEFRELTGYSGKHHRVGVKVLTVVEGNGLPLALTVSKGNTHDVSLADFTFDNLHTPVSKTVGSILLGDKGYDSKYFRFFLAQKGITPNIPKREIAGKKKKKPKDEEIPFNRQLSKRRFVVERTNAWLKSFRRLHFRFDRTLISFEAFLYLGIIVILVRRLIS